MEMENTPMQEQLQGGMLPPEVEESTAQPVGAAQLREFVRVLQKYKAGKSPTESRILASENWWKLRNTTEEQKVSGIGGDGGFVSVSGWLHNVIVSKHADAMEAYPEPNILPREEGDKEEAKKLSAIVPCVLEQNGFERTYSDTAWQKLKTGTGCYKVVWDQSKLNGLGDISVEQVNLLNVYWEPGVTDIQKSRYFFHTELMEKDELEQQYPQLIGKLKGKSFMSTRFLYDEQMDVTNKHTVIDVYYHKYAGSKRVLHYCKFVGDQVLFATENDPKMAKRGLYDHGRYPYEFDPLFPVEGSPCGYGFVDICRNPQTEIDLLKTSFVKNAMVGATPRYWARGEGSVNEEEFLNLSKPIVHANNISEDALRRIEHDSLDSIYVSVLDRTIEELRETSGNTETSTGSTSSGVTAASAIAALQEASGKGSRDSTQSAYRAYTRIVELCIELIRQFYDLPRQFRILGEYGAHQYISYTNAGIKPQHQGKAFGVDMGYRMPAFDIKVSAQKKNVYTKVTQNELALQFFKMGFFNPQMSDQALMCLDMMEFDGKDGIMQKVAKNGGLFQKLVQYMQIALSLAQVAQPEMVEAIMQDMAQTMNGGGAVPMGGGMPKLLQSNNISGIERKEPAIVANARERAGNAAQPDGGKVIGKENKK